MNHESDTQLYSANTPPSIKGLDISVDNSTTLRQQATVTVKRPTFIQHNFNNLYTFPTICSNLFARCCCWGATTIISFWNYAYMLHHVTYETFKIYITKLQYKTA